MLRKTALFLIPLVILSLPALGAKDKVSGRYRFNGVAGYLKPGCEGCEATTMVYLSFEYLLSRNIGLSFGGGFTNFQGPAEAMSGVTGLKEYLTQFEPIDIRRPRLELQYGGMGFLFRAPAGKVAPYVNIGIGAYQYSYSQDVFTIDPYTGETAASIPIFYRKTYFGANAAVGMELLMTEFLSLKIEGNYMRIFSDLVPSQISVSAGFGFIFE
jgi:outer membrane protein W